MVHDEGLSGPPKRVATHIPATLKEDKMPETTLQVIDAELIPTDTNTPDIITDEGLANYTRPDEASQLIEATTTPRDHLLINMLWNTGARIGEVIPTHDTKRNIKTPGVKPSDISQRGIMMFTEKTRNSKKKRMASGDWKLRPEPKIKRKPFRRLIPIKPELFAEIMQYSFMMKLDPGKPLFDITIRRAEQIFKDAAIKAGITYKKISPHSMRHGFAIHYINSGGSIARLQKVLAHSHIQTTMIYLKYADQDLQRDFDRMVF